MKKKFALLMAAPLLALTSCGHASERKLRTGYTGDLVGEFVQTKLGSTTTTGSGEKVKDQKFVFSVKIHAENNVIKSIGWNTDNKDLRYVKDAWEDETQKNIKDGSTLFFKQFEEKKFEDVYYTLIAHPNIFNEDKSMLIYPQGSGSNVRFDTLDFSSGTNSSSFKYWTGKDSETNFNRYPSTSETYKKGMLVEIGAIVSIYHAITKA